MRHLIVILAAAFAANVAFAADATCESKAIDKNGKALAGAAKDKFIAKCEKDAGAPAAAASPECESKAVGKNGKPLAGAAKSAFLKKCMAGSR